MTCTQNDVHPTVEVVAAVGVVAGVGALVAAMVAVVAVVGVVAVGVELFIGEVLALASGSSSSVGARHLRPSSFVSGFLSVGHLGIASGVAIFDLVYDAILVAMYTLSISAEGDCYLCVPPDPGIEATALGASESALPGTAPGKALHTITLDSGASLYFFRDSTTLTPLSATVPVRLANPSGGQVLARSSTVLPCSAVPSGSLSSLHLPSFSTNLVSIAALQDAMVTTTTLGGQRASICTCTRTGPHLATFTCRPGSGLYNLATEPPQVVASAQVSASGPVAPPCSCRLWSHQTLLWHHHLGHPTLPCLRGMHSRLLVSGLPRSLPPLPPSAAPPCLPCVEGRQRAAPYSSSFPPTTAPLQTLHMDVPSPAPRAPRVSLPKTSPTLHWTGKVGDAPVFQVWGSRAFVRDTSMDKLSARAIPCVFLGFSPDAPSWQFYHPTSRRVLPSLDVTFDESVPFCRLFPYRTAPPPPPPAALPCSRSPSGRPPLPQDPAPSGLSQVNPLPGTVPFEFAVESGAARGAASGGAERGGVEPACAEPWGAESERAEPWGAEPEGVEPGLREWFARRTRLQSGASGAGGSAAGGTGAPGRGGTGAAGERSAAGVGARGTRAGAAGGSGAAGPGGDRTGGTGDAGAGGAAGVGAGCQRSTSFPRLILGKGYRLVVLGGYRRTDPLLNKPFYPNGLVVGILTCGWDSDTGDPGPGAAGGTGAAGLGGAQAGGIGAAGAGGVARVGAGDTGAGGTGLGGAGVGSGDTRRPRLYFAPLLQQSAAASALVAELIEFAAACRLDYAASLVTESESDYPPSVGGESALGTEVLEDRQEDFECFSAAVPHLMSMLITSEGDPDAPDIPTPRSYAEAITGPYSSQWQTAMDAEMAS
ncbi:unnamed protein product [Closterium sp. NIES-54]